MENLTHAIYLAFAMLAFVIAFSTSLYLVNKLNTTAKTLVYSIDGSYYDSLALDKIIDNDNGERNRSRIVGVDTIIPTLYRYYKESFAVKILDEHGKLLQYFDTTTEGDVNSALLQSSTAIALAPTDPAYAIEQKKMNKNSALLKLYNNPSLPYYMFGAPWLGSTDEAAKTRIDMYINRRQRLYQ